MEAAQAGSLKVLPVRLNVLGKSFFFLFFFFLFFSFQPYSGHTAQALPPLPLCCTLLKWKVIGCPTTERFPSKQNDVLIEPIPKQKATA